MGCSARVGFVRTLIGTKFEERAQVTIYSEPVVYFDFRTLMDAIAAVLVDGKFNQGDYETVVACAESLFELHIRPFDVPGVGPVVEGFVDDALKRLIRPGIQTLFDRFVFNGGSGRASCACG